MDEIDDRLIENSFNQIRIIHIFPDVIGISRYVKVWQMIHFCSVTYQDSNFSIRELTVLCLLN